MLLGANAKVCTGKYRTIFKESDADSLLCNLCAYISEKGPSLQVPRNTQETSHILREAFSHGFAWKIGEKKSFSLTAHTATAGQIDMEREETSFLSFVYPKTKPLTLAKSGLSRIKCLHFFAPASKSVTVIVCSSAHGCIVIAQVCAPMLMNVFVKLY